MGKRHKSMPLAPVDAPCGLQVRVLYVKSQNRPFTVAPRSLPYNKGGRARAQARGTSPATNQK